MVSQIQKRTVPAAPDGPSPLGTLSLAPSAYRVNTKTGEIFGSDPNPVGLSNAHIQTTASLTVAPHGRLFLLGNCGPDNEQQGGGERGEIGTFSRQSRKRLLQLFASIDESAVVRRSVFITLTYHLKYPSTPEGWYAHLAAFLNRLEYKYKKAATIWRLDFQARGAPHYHLLVCNEPWIDKDLVSRWWAEIAHEESCYQGEYATNCQRPYSWRHACSYVAKYMAKPSTTALPTRTGRFWGVSRKKLLPVHTQTFPLSPAQFCRMKLLMIDYIGEDKLSDYVTKGPAGLWSMMEPSDGMAMLAHALDSTAELADFKLPAKRKSVS